MQTAKRGIWIHWEHACEQANISQAQRKRTHCRWDLNFLHFFGPFCTVGSSFWSYWKALVRASRHSRQALVKSRLSGVLLSSCMTRWNDRGAKGEFFLDTWDSAEVCWDEKESKKQRFWPYFTFWGQEKWFGRCFETFGRKKIFSTSDRNFDRNSSKGRPQDSYRIPEGFLNLDLKESYTGHDIPRFVL